MAQQLVDSTDNKLAGVNFGVGGADAIEIAVHAARDHTGRRKLVSIAQVSYDGATDLLRISRLTTCFSMVANLASEDVPVTAGAVLELCEMTPTERLARVAQRSEPAHVIVRAPDERYEAFLGFVQRSEDELIAELGSEDARDRVLAQASQYGSLIYDLLVAVVPSERMRYLVV